MAYSVDLRKKIIEIYKEGNISQAKLAKHFKIHLNTVKHYLNLDRQKISLKPRVGNRGRPAKINDTGHKIIQQIITKNPTITLEELSHLFYKKTKIKVGRSILSRACLKLKLRHKKLSRYAAESNRDDIKKNAKNIYKK